MRRIIFLLVLVILLAQLAHSQSNPIKLGYVKSASDGCGCSFAYNLAEFWKEKHLFVSPMDEPTFINIDGQDIQLKLIAESNQKTGEKVGDRSWATYVAGDLKVRLD